MIKTYSIEVDCANCANKVEEACKKVTGVSKLNINFMTQKMTVDFTEGSNENDVMKAIEKTAKKIENDFEINL